MKKGMLICVLASMVAMATWGCAANEKVDTMEEPETEVTQSGPLMAAVDYSGIFGGIEGCAVVYRESDHTYYLYNEELCRTQASPWSTFKIAATLMGLHNQVITSEESCMGYDQTVYPMEGWNQDLPLVEAFRQSCVWYFRKVIDGVGEEEVCAELQALNYGNHDSSQWSGSGVNPLPELNGFWLGSSLKVSPFEQVEMLRAIFEGTTAYTEKEVEILKSCMRTEADGEAVVYGKTGTGQAEGWYVGACEQENDITYFAVYLNDSDSALANGAEARRIALEILF